MSKSLPSRPNLEQLKNQAKDLLKSFQAGNSEALQRMRESHPRWSSAPEPELHAAELSLVDAQLVIAREYGFASWPKLKEHVDAVLLDAGEPMELFKRAFAQHDAVLFQRLLDRHPDLKARINEPVAAFDAPVVTRVRSREMLDVLLAAGADINAKSRWWAGGFGLLHGASPELAAYAIERGAVVDVHAAARLGMTGNLRELIEADPALVNARGGDGQTPLHFASTIEVAEYLLDRGAEIDARDVDHESTPAQYMVRERQDVLRYLVRRGCQTDVLMASALGDAALVRKHLDADPECVRMRVSDEYFPMINHKAGGTIYQWTLGWYVSAHDVAKQFGHEAHGTQPGGREIACSLLAGRRNRSEISARGKSRPRRRSVRSLPSPARSCRPQQQPRGSALDARGWTARGRPRPAWRDAFALGRVSRECRNGPGNPAP